MRFDEHDFADPSRVLSPEWLVTNGMGGYAAGTLAGVITRRYHGVLVAALPPPLGRFVMVSQVGERLRLPNGDAQWLSGEEREGGRLYLEGANRLRGFRLEAGLPVWIYELDGYVVEKRLVFRHFTNTVLITYRLLSGDGTTELDIRPLLNGRPHEAPVSHPLPAAPALTSAETFAEVRLAPELPPLRLQLCDCSGRFIVGCRIVRHLHHRVEHRRGYEANGAAWSPGYFRIKLQPGRSATFVASTDPAGTIAAVTADQALSDERSRRARLLDRADPVLADRATAELVLAADQFVVTPAERVADADRTHGPGEQVRSVIAGYHWFTDWGRDTMISLEGLTLTTGRLADARDILKTFGFYVRDGLIPNLFPEGDDHGLYHTADATLWYFHALDRYLETSGDWPSVRSLLPTLDDCVTAHIRGTRFNIGVDPADGLLRQGAAGFALTWMDAKVEDWVVTPRRGKAVEINALWYNALRLLADWHERNSHGARATELRQRAAITYQWFNRRFWYEDGGHLYDVIDGERGDDNACRPNQILSCALRYPVLDEKRWVQVLTTVHERLLTPFGLRTLDPADPEYRPQYDGDLRSRDAAYHQGTVWPWLIGPFIDVWIKVHPESPHHARQFLTAFIDHLDEACVGSISEIFDAEEPYRPRGCVAQAWSVGEVLRCWVKTAQRFPEGDWSRQPARSMGERAVQKADQPFDEDEPPHHPFGRKPLADPR